MSTSSPVIILQVRPFQAFSFSNLLVVKLIRIRSEVNLANNAQAWRTGHHPGYEPSAWEGIQQTIDIISQKGIRVVINGGALDPKALALKVEALVSERFSLDRCLARRAIVPLTEIWDD